MLKRSSRRRQKEKLSISDKINIANIIVNLAILIKELFKL